MYNVGMGVFVTAESYRWVLYVHRWPAGPRPRTAVLPAPEPSARRSSSRSQSSPSDLGWPWTRKTH